MGKLSESTDQSTKEAFRYLKKIKELSSNGKDKMEKTAQTFMNLFHGNQEFLQYFQFLQKSSQEYGKKLVSIGKFITEVSDYGKELSQNMGEKMREVIQATKTIEQIDFTFGEITEQTEDLAKTSQELSQRAHQLKEIVYQFKVADLAENP